MTVADTTTFKVDSETGPLLDVLVCPTDHFEWIPVNTTSLRTLASGAQLDRATVVAQHAELVDALRTAGVTVHELEPRPEHPYMVYTRDSSQMTPWGPVINQMRWEQRWGEFFWLKEWYERTGNPPWHYVTNGTVEGGDVSVCEPGLLIVGASGVRTSEAGAAQLCGWFAERDWDTYVVPFDDHFCHLDLLFDMVAPGLALVCEDGLPEDFLRFLDARRIRRIPVSYREAIQVQANVLALGNDRVVSPRMHTRINDALRAEGLEVLDPDLSELVKGGGSAHCLTQAMRRA
jgi:N-dimethylarginine dimethylaminohydrolase